MFRNILRHLAYGIPILLTISGEELGNSKTLSELINNHLTTRIIGLSAEL